MPRTGVNLGPFRLLTKHIRSVSGPFGNAMIRWAIRYREFVQKRFVRLGSGGGEWPRLKRKRKRGKLVRAKILRDTGALLAALSPVFSSAAGAIQRRINKGIRVGYGGPAKHSKGRVTVAQIAHWHQVGAGNLPVRKIIVQPSRRVRQLMGQDLIRAAREV